MSKEADDWALKLGRFDLRYFVEDAIDFSGHGWERASDNEKREYLQFLINFTEKT